MTQPGRVGRAFRGEGALCTKARGQGWSRAVRVDTMEVSKSLETMLKILDIESPGKP